MQEISMNHVMIILAVAMVIIGGLVLGLGRFAAAQAGEPLPPAIRRNAIILIVAGPLCLVSWLLLNGLLENVGYRSVFGYCLAALVFVGGGFLTGFFSRLRLGRKGAASDTPETPQPAKDVTE